MVLPYINSVAMQQHYALSFACVACAYVKLYRLFYVVSPCDVGICAHILPSFLNKIIDNHLKKRSSIQCGIVLCMYQTHQTHTEEQLYYRNSLHVEYVEFV